MKRPAANLEAQQAAAPAAPAAPSRLASSSSSALAQRRLAPRSLEEVEERYVAARDAWTKAMRAANSGRSADLALLALSQEAYELAAAERERWLSGGAVPIPIEEESRSRVGLNAIVGNELEWRRVRTHHEPHGVLARLRRRITGR